MTTTFFLKQGDTLPVIAELLLNGDGTPIDLTDADVEFHLVPRSTSIPLIAEAAEVVDADTGHVQYEWQPGDSDIPGFYHREWEVTFGDGTVVTVPNDRRGFRVVITEQIETPAS